MDVTLTELSTIPVKKIGKDTKMLVSEKAEEIFEKLHEAGIEPDVYPYNALMEAYSRAGFPYGVVEFFLLMQHMGCEPDRASFNIMVDAYGRSGLHEGKKSY
ncbi:pentatricopeptide repeat-containing protein [Tanacetum coccineum]